MTSDDTGHLGVLHVDRDRVVFDAGTRGLARSRASAPARLGENALGNRRHTEWKRVLLPALSDRPRRAIAGLAQFVYSNEMARCSLSHRMRH